MTLRNVGFFQDVITNHYYPPEMIEEIYLRMPLKDIIRTIPTSQTTAFVGRSDSLFKKLFKKYFGVDINDNCMQKFALYYQFSNALAKIKHANLTKTINDKMIEDFSALYNQLKEYRENTASDLDKNWTSHLLGLFYAENFFRNKISALQHENSIETSDQLLIEAANLGNPFSMLEVANNILNASCYVETMDENEKLEIEAIAWANKALQVGSDCPELNYKLAAFFEFRDSVKSYELLIKAAKAGHTEAAYQLALCYIAKPNETNYIPFSENEWQALEYIHQLRLSFASDTPELRDMKLAKLASFVENGSATAAHLLAAIYTEGCENLTIDQNDLLVEQNNKLRNEIDERNLPERRERAIYWLEEAAKGGHKEAIDFIQQLTESKKTEEMTNPVSGPKR